MKQLYKTLFSLFHDASVDEQYEFIRLCPFCIYTDTALQFLQLNMPNSNLAALDALCNGYNGKQEHTRLAYLLSIVLTEIGILQYQNIANISTSEEALVYATNGVYFQTKFLFDESLYDSAIQAADGNIPFLAPPKRYQYERLVSAQLIKVEALIMLNRFDEARACFQQLETLPLPAGTEMHRYNLKQALDKLFLDATVVRSTDKTDLGRSANSQKIKDVLAESLQSMADANNPHLLNISSKLADLSSQLENSSEPESPEAYYQRIISESALTYGTFKGFFGNVSIHDIQQKTEQIGTIFFDPTRSHNPTALNQALQEYAIVCQQVESQQIPYDLQAVWWAMAICHNRLKQYREGLALTEKIWADIEFQRTQISSYTERAGLLNKFEFLFTRLADFYFELNDYQGVFHAIESSKGRVLADVLDRRNATSTIVPGVNDLDVTVKALVNILREQKAHYLTYLLEEDYCFAVLITSSGEFFANRIDIGKTKLQHWLTRQQQNPQKWQTGGVGLFGQKSQPNITDLLSPLVSWLQPLRQNKKIILGDHICYCPDGDLNLFPFHYIQLEGKPLIESFTLSRTQGVHSLLKSFQKPSLAPASFVSIVATCIEDDEDASKIEGFRRSTEYLNGFMSGNMVDGKDTDFHQLSSISLASQLVHFSTHGTFPTESAGNPYSDSGLLVFDGENMPSLNQIEFGHLITPQRLLSANLNFSQSHITLQACVSGRSKEGIGGDALGLEWAFLMSGASSVLASNWDVDYHYAAMFCCKFYDYWLKQGLSRGQAFQQTALYLIHSHLPTQHPAPYYWAGFTLMGDWR